MGREQLSFCKTAATSSHIVQDMFIYTSAFNSSKFFCADPKLKGARSRRLNDMLNDIHSYKIIFSSKHVIEHVSIIIRLKRLKPLYAIIEHIYTYTYYPIIHQFLIAVRPEYYRYLRPIMIAHWLNRKYRPLKTRFAKTKPAKIKSMLVLSYTYKRLQRKIDGG